MEYHCFVEKMKKEAKTCCCLDFNGVVGRSLTEKFESVYATLIRMQYITRKVSGKLPDVLIVQPVVYAVLDIIGVLDKSSVDHIKLDRYEYKGRAWGLWAIYLDEEAYMEHHFMMTNLVDGKLSDDPKLWCKVSLLNFIMANNFGYFNMW